MVEIYTFWEGSDSKRSWHGDTILSFPWVNLCGGWCICIHICIVWDLSLPHYWTMPGCCTPVTVRASLLDYAWMLYPCHCQSLTTGLCLSVVPLSLRASLLDYAWLLYPCHCQSLTTELCLAVVPLSLSEPHYWTMPGCCTLVSASLLGYAWLHTLANASVLILKYTWLPK